jgi:hypothetical protein
MSVAICVRMPSSARIRRTRARWNA